MLPSCTCPGSPQVGAQGTGLCPGSTVGALRTALLVVLVGRLHAQLEPRSIVAVSVLLLWRGVICGTRDCRMSCELQRYLRELLSIGWLTPSLSPWAVPVLFVPKKVDLITGKRTWRMCISNVKLNSKTLNRIAYRLPLISELLERVKSVAWPECVGPLATLY